MRNNISTCLMGIGILLLVIGFIEGLILGNAPDGFHMTIALYWWLSGVTAGFIFIGLSEIVNLLQKLVTKFDADQPVQSGILSLFQPTTSRSIEEKIAEVSDTKVKDLTILIDDVRFRGFFVFTDAEVKVMKKSLFQAESEAVLIKEISKNSLSADFERDADYVIFHFTEGSRKHKLAFKTFNIYDYERIINLFKQRESR
ncbi:hypothetical protein [Paenibacillus sp. JDR-2]|uniref:hypothetical protein n=1 Tax=Paenibacillus sp. (strain JDR-2) TaxID=324057 RepID=UPI0001667A13|nr:hypothetical protein [Paenibacillus sp. JDR-2]ACT02277.1 hypothetical protein Pjdr2_3645 [Paenibacillus sp. JDR-2]